MGEFKDMARAPARMPQGEDMAALLRPFDTRVVPYGFGHGGRHDGIVSSGKGKHGAIELLLSGTRVPMHQPIEPFVEPRYVQRLGQSEASGAAGTPKGLKRGARVPLQATLQGGDTRLRHM